MTSPTSAPIGRGTLLAGRYRLEDLLADSEGARFWRATDTVLARSVAVHAVHSDDDRSPELLEAARLSATVNDQHLLRVLDCDDADGICWVVQEWGEGLSLDLMLQRGPLAPSRAAWLAKEVAQAIAVGHARGVPHGRLNPESVLVTHSGAVKLLGYVVDDALHRPPPLNPVYGQLDAREADVIDVAGVLYAARTGRWPGVAESAVPPAPLEGRRPLRPRQVRAGVPRALDAICERVLHREGSRHELPIETVDEIAAALADFTGEPASGSVPMTAMHDEPTSVLSRAGLAEEARKRSLPAEEAVDPEDAPDTGAETDPEDAPETDADPDATGEMGPLPTVPAMESTALHREPLESPDSTSPLRAPDRVPPPPPFEDSPERPLFATTQRRVPAAARAATTTQQSPTVRPPAPVPAAEPSQFWPFEGDDPPAPPGNGQEGRGWLRTAVVVGVLLATVVAMVAAFSLGRGSGFPLVGGGDDEPSESASPRPQSLSIAGVSDFDPEGDQTENPDQAANVIDGDPATTWSTVTYYNRPDLGGLKSGVGLVLDLGEDQAVGEVTVRFGSAPTSFRLYAAPEGTSSAPTALDQLQEVGGQDGAPERTTVQLDPAPTTRYLLLWLTELPAAPGGYRGEVAEVNVRS